MAINFPSNPVEGQTYDFHDVRYTFTLVGGAPGYWRILQPGLGGAANPAEINAGLISDKYIAPDALNQSEYMRKFLLGTNGATFSEIPKDNILNVNVGNGLQVSQGPYGSIGRTLNIVPKDASTVQKGQTLLSTSVASTQTDRAATPSAVKQTHDLASSTAWSTQNRAAQGGFVKSSTNVYDALAGNGMLFQWGKINFGGVPPNPRYVPFPTPFTQCYGVQCQATEPDGIEVNTGIVKTLDGSGFTLLHTGGGNLFVDYYWFAYGVQL